MSSSEKVRVELTSSADTSGIDKMADASKKLTGGNKSAAEAAYDAGEKTKGMARGLGEGAAAGNAAVSAMAQLSTASKGGAEGMMAIARAGFAAGVSLKAVMASMGPFGIAAAAIGIAMGVVSLAFRKSEEAAADAKTKIEELNKTKLDLAVKQQKALEDAADAVLKKIDAEYAAMQRVADAELGRRKSGVDADVAEGKLSKEEGDRRKITLDRQREDEKRVALLEAAEAKAQELERIESESAKTLASRNAEYERQVRALAELESATKNLQSAEVAISSGGKSGFGAGAEDYEALGAAKSRLESARKATEGLNQSTVETAKKLADDQAERARTDRERTDAARAAADTERNTQAVENPIRADTRRNEDRARRQRSDDEKAADTKAREKQDAEIRRTPAAIWSNRMAMQGGVDDATAEAVRRNYPGYKFAQRPTVPVAPLTPSVPIADLAAQASDAARAGQLPTLPKVLQRGGGALPGDGAPKDERIQIDAKPLDKGLKENATKLKSEIDKQLAQISAGVAANSVALTTTAAAAATLATAQTQMRATIEQMQSQLANLRP